jgi:hypothetical protein
MLQAVPSIGWRHAGGAGADDAADADPAIPMAWLVGLAPTATLAMFDLPPGVPVPAGQIDGLLDGTPLPRPVLSTRLALRTGGTRCLVLLPRAASDLARAPLRFRLAGRTVALVDPDWLQSPLVPRDDLIDGVAPTAVPRLIRFLLPNVAARLAPADMPDFRATVRALLDRLDVARGTLALRCAAGDSTLILTYRLDGPVDSRLPPDAVLLGPQRVDSVAPLVACAEGADLLHLALPHRALRPIPDIVLVGARTLYLAAEAAPLAADPADWLGRRPAAVRTWAEAVLSRAAPTDAGAAAVLADGRVTPDEAPAVRRAHVAATRTGVLVWADVGDPRGLGASLHLQCRGHTARVALPDGGQVRAFLPWHPSPDRDAPRPGDTLRLRVCGRSGRPLATLDTPLSALAAALPDGFATDDPQALAPSLARAWADRLPPATGATVLPCGPGAARPRLTLITPLTPDPDMIRARATLVAAEGPGVEVDCLATGHPAPALVALLAQVARTTGVAHRILVLPDATPAVDAVLAGLHTARGTDTLLLGASVLPDGAGWLTRLLGALGGLQGTGILGGTVLHPDGAVHHAGGRLAVSDDGLPRVSSTGTGLPAADLGTGTTLRSDLFTVDAAGLTAAGRAAILAAGACLPDPDLAMLPAILRAGAGQVSLVCRFTRFGGPPGPDPVARAASLWLIADAAAGPTGSADTPTPDSAAPDTPTPAADTPPPACLTSDEAA